MDLSLQEKMNNQQDALINYFNEELQKKGYVGGVRFFFTQDENGFWQPINRDKIPNHYAVTVIKEFTFEEYTEVLCDMITSLTVEEKKRWLLSFTKMYFTFGNPERVRHKYNRKLLFGNKAIAMTPPIGGNVLFGIKSLLVNWNPDGVVETPSAYTVGKQVGKQIVTVFTHGLNKARVLVHLSHIIAEGSILQYLSPGEGFSVVIKEMPDKSELEKISNARYRRIDVEETDRDKFLIYGYII